jgi:hypothetical protein
MRTFLPFVIWTTLLLLHVRAAPAIGAAIPIVSAGRAVADIVTADRPSPVAQYAAAELAWHIEKATGVRLPVTTESAPPANFAAHIYVGHTKAASDAGIDVSKLPPEELVLRTKGAALFIAGEDGPGDPLSQDTHAGTLWGVYEWLERTLHVHWLWPGELGTFVPRTDAIASPALEQHQAPQFLQRKIRLGLEFPSEHPAMGFTKAAFEKYQHDELVFLRRHRMGRSQHLSYGHAFTNWWKTDGAAHPDWFQLRADGKRGPSKPTARFSMCVSNPDLQREIVERWQRKSKPDGVTPSYINACENDYLGTCTCPVCRALDGPTPPDYLTYYSPTSKMAGSHFVSDRYAHFWLGIQQRAAPIDPQATVIGYVYFNYFQAPTSGVKLNDHILLGFCPSGGMFPRSADEHEWMKRQWTGWRDTGARLFLRSNYLLDGYVMPYIYAHQFADEFQLEARQGMVGTDLDSLTGHWATQGPNLYVAARLHVHPAAPVDELLAEFYSGFGAAAAPVQKYFEYWEDFTTRNREHLVQVMEQTQTSRWRSWAKAADAVYPPECFVPAESFLAEAAKAAAPDAGAASRVQFLQLGLQHAKLCTQAAAQLSLAKAEAAPATEAKAVLAALLQFRRAHEQSGISNFNHAAWLEDAGWKLGNETKQPAEVYP